MVASILLRAVRLKMNVGYICLSVAAIACSLSWSVYLVAVCGAASTCLGTACLFRATVRLWRTEQGSNCAGSRATATRIVSHGGLQDTHHWFHVSGHWRLCGVGLSYGFPIQSCLLAGGLCSVAGILPDLDSDSGVPYRESVAFISAFVPLLLINRFESLGWTARVDCLGMRVDLHRDTLWCCGSCFGVTRCIEACGTAFPQRPRWA